MCGESTADRLILKPLMIALPPLMAIALAYNAYAPENVKQRVADAVANKSPQQHR